MDNQTVLLALLFWAFSNASSSLNYIVHEEADWDDNLMFTGEIVAVVVIGLKLLGVFQ